MVYLLPTILLATFGILNLFGIESSLFTNQLANFLVGLFIFFFIKKKGVRFLRNHTFLFYWLLVVSLILTYFSGIESKGARRWLDLYFIGFQPSEFLKVIFILFFANFFTKYFHRLNNFSTFMLSLVYFAVPFVLVLKQPDLGSALIFVFIYFLLLLFSNLSKKYWLYLVFILILTLPINWLFLRDYQKQRIISFINHEVDQQGTSYNMVQSMIAVGSGKFLGRGLGLGTQSRLYFLPENHTDFAFASLIEQFGFFGGFIVIILYLVLSFLITRRLLTFIPYERDEDNRFNFLFTLGFLGLLTYQVFINIGMNLGIIPIAGIGLPFISYGGSSVIAFLALLALVP